MSGGIVPETFADWRHCIEVTCGLHLTPDFTEERLAALADDRDPHNRRFVTQWGEAHRRRVLDWLARAKAISADA